MKRCPKCNGEGRIWPTDNPLAHVPCQACHSTGKTGFVNLKELKPGDVIRLHRVSPDPYPPVKGRQRYRTLTLVVRSEYKGPTVLMAFHDRGQLNAGWSWYGLSDDGEILSFGLGILQYLVEKTGKIDEL